MDANPMDLRDAEAISRTREIMASRLADAEAAVERWRAVVAALDLALASLPTPQISLADALRAPASLNGTSYAGWTQSAATKDYLSKAGASKVPQIADALLARGITTNSEKHFRTNIHSMLRKVDWAEKLADGRWQVRQGK